MDFVMTFLKFQVSSMSSLLERVTPLMTVMTIPHPKSVNSKRQSTTG